MLRVLSLGAGVQSTTLALLAAESVAKFGFYVSFILVLLLGVACGWIWGYVAIHHI